MSANSQTSPGNASCLHAYVRRIYFRDFRTGIGLRVVTPSCPSRLPHMRFLFVEPALCHSELCSLGFLQIPPREGHPCLRLYGSPCRVRSGLGDSSPHLLAETPCRAHVNYHHQRWWLEGPWPLKEAIFLRVFFFTLFVILLIFHIPPNFIFI